VSLNCHVQYHQHYHTSTSYLPLPSPTTTQPPPPPSTHSTHRHCPLTRTHHYYSRIRPLTRSTATVHSLAPTATVHSLAPIARAPSFRYDTYSSVALPLPSTSTKQLEVLVITSDLHAPAYEVKISVSKKGTSKDIIDECVAKLPGKGLSSANLVLVEILHGKVYKTLYSPRFPAKEYDLVDKLLDNDILMAYQVLATHCDPPFRSFTPLHSTDRSTPLHLRGHQLPLNPMPSPTKPAPAPAPTLAVTIPTTISCLLRTNHHRAIQCLAPCHTHFLHLFTFTLPCSPYHPLPFVNTISAPLSHTDSLPRWQVPDQELKEVAGAAADALDADEDDDDFGYSRSKRYSCVSLILA
jgi:hypothetical protein